MERKLLSIIVVNFKTDEFVIQFVKEECSKILLPNTIIIVNNSATKESNDFISKNTNAVIIYDIHNDIVGNGNVFLINNPYNSGYAQANNLGAIFVKNHFKSKYILFANPDIKIINSDVVDQLINKIETDDNIGMIGPKIIGLDGKLQSPNERLRLWKNFVFFYFSAKFCKNKPKAYWETAEEGYHYQIMGSFFLVSAKYFYDCGMMDPHTFLYYEEAILSERMKKINKGVYYLPKVAVLHNHGESINKFYNSIKRSRLKWQSATIYFHEYRKKPLLLINCVKIINYLINYLLYIKSK